MVKESEFRSQLRQAILVLIYNNPQFISLYRHEVTIDFLLRFFSSPIAVEFSICLICRGFFTPHIVYILCGTTQVLPPAVSALFQPLYEASAPADHVSVVQFMYSTILIPLLSNCISSIWSLNKAVPKKLMALLVMDIFCSN